MKLILIILLTITQSFASELTTYDVTSGSLLDRINFPLATDSLKKKHLRLKAAICANSRITCMNRDYLERLIGAFLTAEKNHGVPALILQAIARIESSYVLNAVNPKSNDYGIMQINQYHIGSKSNQFSKEKLLTDLQYSVNAGAIVLKWFYRTYPFEEAIRRYNCGTEKKCIYQKSVKQYLRRFKNAM